MDKNSIKNYAIWARTELISRVSLKANEYGIFETGCGDENAEVVDGRVLSALEKEQRKSLIKKVRKDGFQRTTEEAAYAWFNRFAAIRFMEVNGYLPSGIRVFTDENGAFKPEILAEAARLQSDDLDGLDPAKVVELKLANKTDELYKYLLVVQCNALGKILPRMFAPIPEDDYTILLLPDNLLREESVVGRMIADIPEEDWKNQVQIIGWLYQYYNAEPKAEVFANLKKNVKIEFDKIPAATQLFTPDWIVRYMVENSLGRLWVEGRGKPENADWKYYLDEAKQEPDVEARLAELRKKRAELNPEEIKCLDPCMGSGHILVYMFDVLIQIYESCGYAARDAASLIMKKNLYGLDIDERAAQLAYFAVTMKARQYDKRFFSRGIQPNVFVVADSDDFDDGLFDYFVGDDPKLQLEWNKLVSQTSQAKEFGSLVEISGVDLRPIQARLEALKKETNGVYAYQCVSTIAPLVRTAEILATKYDVVCTNPPYMGGANMNAKLSAFIKNNYPEYKTDLFSAFIVKCSHMTKRGGYLGFLTPYVWMFIQSYENLRNFIYSSMTLETLIQFEYSAFGEATVPICSFTLSNKNIEKNGCYLRLTEFRGGMETQRQKTLEAISNHQCGFYYESNQENFAKIPGSPVAYWWKNYTIFDKDKIDCFYESAGRNKTHNNELYVRLWWEIYDKQKWQPYANGGAFRRWYGNSNDLVNWSEEAKNDYNSHGGLYNQKFLGLQGVCWNLITSYKNGFRLKIDAQHYSSAAPTIICKNKKYDYYLLAYLNGIVAENILKIYNSTLNTTVGDVLGLPFIISQQEKVERLSKLNIALSKADWDSFETSWDFRRHPLINGEKTLAKAFDRWAAECEERFQTLKANEEELNRIFIDIYGLNDELSPEVEEKDVTVRRADRERDVKSFISYAVGCLFGRYSLDVDGLAFAGGDRNEAEESKFRSVPEKLKNLIPDPDNIIPICDDDYFPDDLTGLFVDFVEWAYGPESLEENLRFVADALGKKGAPRSVLRDYFLKDFYRDHCQTYQKRPIYWLFDSGKKNGFKALVYLHRYQPDALARIRTDYVFEQQSRYRSAIEDRENRKISASTSERVKLDKELKAFKEQAEEVRVFEEKIHHLADRMIEIDLDDGVKRNYELFADVLAPIK